MGGTLPVLSRFVSRQPDDLRSQLSFLYGFNTLGAVLGALLAGFVFLRCTRSARRCTSPSATNVLIGLVSLALQARVAGQTPRPRPGGRVSAGAADPRPVAADPLPRQLVLWGIGLSGFCALGYEVLWTRMLTLAVGASVYGFTIILVAFLTGIALGSKAYGAVVKVFRITIRRTRGGRSPGSG